MVDDEERLKGRLSLKDLLTTSTKTPISDVYIKKVDYVKVDTKDVEVARIMQKYDLEAIPVVDELGRLVGRITIDDIIDVIKEEADKDYQLAAGISQDVEADDSILELTKSTFALVGFSFIWGFISVHVLGIFEPVMDLHPELFFFTPLIAADGRKCWCPIFCYYCARFSKQHYYWTSCRAFIKRTFLEFLNGFILSAILF